MNIIEKYKGFSEPIKASIWFTVCSFLQKGIQFITVPIFTRMLTTEQYGLFNVFNSWLQIVMIFATLNLYCGVFNNGMLKYEDDRDRYVSSMQGVSTTVTLLCLGVYLLNTGFWNRILELPTVLVLAMFVEVLFIPAISFWSAKQRFDYKYKALVLLTIGMSIADPLIGILAVMSTEYKGEAKILSAVLVQVVVGLLIYIYNAFKGKSFYVKEYWKFAIAFNVPLIPHYLSQTVLNNSDRIIINQICGGHQAGIYSVAYSAAMILSIINFSVNNSFIPWTYKKMKSEEYNDIGKVANFILILIAGMNLALIAFAPEAISILAPKQYFDAIWVIPPVAVSVYFMFMYTLFGNIEFYFEENKFVMFASIIGAILNIVLNYMFIPIYGYIVAAYTTLGCYILYSVSHYIFMKRVIRDHVGKVDIYDLKFIFILSAVFMGMSAILMFFYNHIVIRYLFILVLIVTAFVKKNDIIEKLKMLKNK